MPIQGVATNPPSTGQAAQGGNTFFVSPDGGIPRTGDEWRALQRVRSQLSSQITNVTSRREELADQLKNADPSARQGLIDRIKVLDDRIIIMEKELARTGVLQQNTPLSVVNDGSTANPPQFLQNMGNEIIPIVAILSVFVLGPLALSISRLIWRRANNPPVKQVLSDQAAQQRLDQLQQAVDTIAIEVERISEGQRFISKALADRALPAGVAEPIKQGAKVSAAANRG